MKFIDVLAAVLLVIGGLNWGLIGLFGYNLVGSLFGAGSAIPSIVYSLVGFAAVYQALCLRSIQRRWHVRPATV